MDLSSYFLKAKIIRKDFTFLYFYGQQCIYVVSFVVYFKRMTFCVKISRMSSPIGKVPNQDAHNSPTFLCGWQTHAVEKVLYNFGISLLSPQGVKFKKILLGWLTISYQACEKLFTKSGLGNAQTAKENISPRQAVVCIMLRACIK